MRGARDGGHFGGLGACAKPGRAGGKLRSASWRPVDDADGRWLAELRLDLGLLRYLADSLNKRFRIA